MHDTMSKPLFYDDDNMERLNRGFNNNLCHLPYPLNPQNSSTYRKRRRVSYYLRLRKIDNIKRK